MVKIKHKIKKFQLAFINQYLEKENEVLKSKNDIVKKLNSFNLTYDIFKKELIKVVGNATKSSEINLYTPLLKRVINNLHIKANFTYIFFYCNMIGIIIISI